MIYYWRIFLWENGHKSTEYTNHVVAPIFLEDKLDETLDSGEVVLKAMPIATRNAFPPKTKFRLERYTKEDYTDTPRKWDLVVEHDDVEEYEGCPDICTHRVNLIEASVIAQGMHVDNIALTYELQDVDLNYRTTKEDEGATVVEEKRAGYTYGNFVYGGAAIAGGPGAGYLLDPPADYWNYTQARPNISYFDTTAKYEWSNTESLKGKISNLSSGKVNHIEFDIPKLTAFCGTGGDWEAVAELPTRTTVTYTKYTQRAIQQADGSYTQDTRFEKTAVATGTVVDVTSYPQDTSSFKTLEGRTKVNGNHIYILETPYNGYLFNSSNSNGGMRILGVKWLNDGSGGNSATEADEILRPLSYCYPGNHHETASFDTIVMSDAEAVYTDENGNTFMAWYEYKIQTREAIYGAGSQVGITHQYYSCKNYWVGTSHDKFICSKTLLAYDTFESNPNKNPIVYVETTIFVSGMLVDASGGAFLVKAKKYSCYELLRKALLTIDTQIINNSETGLDYIESLYPITVHQDWVARLQVAQMQETIFEGKNLWEVLLQIGYYLHAIPYLEFADDGTDRFVLTFRQLGDTKQKADTSRKITVFNSRNLSDYFAQYDSYVTNLFSPQNEIDEWLVAKTSDSTYLVSNDTAEIKTSRPILEIIEFDIIYGGRTVDALQYIFEESVYQVLTSDNPQRMKPAKGNALYYKLGDNTITGLNYLPPQKNPGTYFYALQEICRRLFGLSNPAELKFNDLIFHVKYRTQDELRISQVRPDIQNFMRNSSLEKYPHHEQYYGQQDKIIDSERFSANLFGQLIRVGNTEYQRQEYATDTDEKESGDLVTINDDAYYVIATENEYYPDAIKQKVTYSKNFNQLSKIVTIPSEPRFYEVSERSKIRREVRLMDFLELTTTKPTQVARPRFLSNAKWKALIKGLIFNKQAYTLPNFAYTKFVADYKREHTGAYGQYISPESLFPSSDVIRQGTNGIKPAGSKDHSDCIVSLLYFPLHDGIVFEWDMEDNFKAGDFIDSEISGVNEKGEAYLAQQSCRYVDVMGRADLFTFRLFSKSNWTQSQAQQLPKAVTIPSESSCDIYLPSPYLIGLDKDNREAISFNYQINLLHRPTSADTEDFFTFPNLFGQKDSPLKMCLLSEPQSLFNENLNLSPHDILADEIGYSLIDNGSYNAIEVRIPTPSGVDLTAVKSIALYTQTEEGSERVAYIIKNVERLPNNRKLQSWWICSVFSD